MNAIQEIEKYKNKRILPNIKKFNEEYIVTEHQIFKNKYRYPDREVISDYIDENGDKKTKTTTIPLNRIGLPYQKKIVSIATTFLCGEPVKYTNNTQDTNLYDAFVVSCFQIL